MTLIHVPRPDPKRSWNPSRPVSSLLKAQIEHLHDAERRLPLHHRTEVYINAIKTEGEAAQYIRKVTEAIHNAHHEAAAQRARSVARRRRGIEIAAVADERPIRRRTGGGKAKKKKPKRGRKK